MDERTASGAEAQRRFDSRFTVVTIVTGVGIGLAGIGVYAACSARLPQAGVIASFGLLISGASLAVGGLLGFLFGIPRALQHDPPPVPQPSAESAGASVEGGPSGGYRVNTNLEQISDWLTKIIVGVGLTQIGNVPSFLRGAGDYLKAGLGGATGSDAVALTVVLYFSTCGFLLGYLWTRLFLTGQFAESDLAAQAKEARTAAAVANQRVQQLETQAKADARALALAYQQLDSQQGITAVDPVELTKAIQAASGETRAQIFYRASGLRASTWADDKALMEQTIPIFRALIESDENDEFHLNHGQLGFALKDKRAPEWAEAEREITRAIELRGDWHGQGWLFYEFNRALCRIALDVEFLADKPSSPERRLAILADLREATHDRHVRKVLVGDQTVQKWLKLNGLGASDLESTSH